MAELSQGWLDAWRKRTLTHGSHFPVVPTLLLLQQDVNNLSFYKYFNAPDAKFCLEQRQLLYCSPPLSVRSIIVNCSLITYDRHYWTSTADRRSLAANWGRSYVKDFALFIRCPLNRSRTVIGLYRTCELFVGTPHRPESSFCCCVFSPRFTRPFILQLVITIRTDSRHLEKHQWNSDYEKSLWVI